MTKSFVPCYEISIEFFNSQDEVFRANVFEVDYFFKDRFGVNMYERIQDEFCIPYYHTVIHFRRLNK